jgi:HSP20 family protein
LSDVQVYKMQPEGESVLLRTQQVDALYDEIRRRAFRLFESRGSRHGNDWEDWLEAERSLIFAPPAELVEEDNQFGIRMAVPGLEARHIRVNVLPRTLIVDGDSTEPAEQRDQKVWFSEFSNRKLFRRVDLPEEVRAFTVQATLKDRILQISVRKAAQGSGEGRQSAAAAPEGLFSQTGQPIGLLRIARGCSCWVVEHLWLDLLSLDGFDAAESFAGMKCSAL